MESISTATSHSRNTVMFKSVFNVIHSHKRVVSLYIFTICLMLTSVYFTLIFEYINRMLKNFNRSNVNNFHLTSQFILLDNSLLESVETLLTYHEYLRAQADPVQKQLTHSSFDRLMPNVSPEKFFLANLKDSVDTFRSTLVSINYQNLAVVDETNMLDELEQVNQPANFSYSNPELPLSQTTEVVGETLPGWTRNLYLAETLGKARRAIEELGRLSDPVLATPVADLARLDDRISVIQRDLIVSVLDGYLARMKSLFDEVSIALVIADINEHFGEINPMLIATGVVSGIYIAGLVFSVFYNTAFMKHQLSNYSMLKNWEIYMMQEDVLIEMDTFTRGFFNELHLANKYLEFNTLKYTGDIQMRSNSHQAKFQRAKGAFKLRHNRSFSSISRLIMVSMMGLSLYGLTLITVFSFLAVNSKRFGMQHLFFDTYMSMVDVERSYFCSFLFATSGNYYQVAGTKVLDNQFERAVDNFLVYITDKKRDYEFYYGTGLSERANQLFFDDLCPFIPIHPDDQIENLGFNFRPLCQVINSGSLKKGIVGYTQHLENYLETLNSKIRLEYPVYLQDSQTTLPTALREILFSPEFVGVRMGRWLSSRFFYKEFLRISELRTWNIKEDMNYYVAGWVYYFSLAIGVIVVILYIWVAFSQKYDLDVCYEIFWLIDPMFLANNKLLQSQLKSSFHGIG